MRVERCDLTREERLALLRHNERLERFECQIELRPVERSLSSVALSMLLLTGEP